MFERLRRFVARLILSENDRFFLLLRFHGFLYESGWARSVLEGDCVDLEGNRLPWLSYPAIDLLKQRIRPYFRVFEYGSGSSTQWFACHVAKVVSCEHDKKWYQKVKLQVNSLKNVDLHYHPLEYGGKYCRCITEVGEKFDLVLVDGRDRNRCIKQAHSCLTDEGVLILDNSERVNYQEGREFMLSHDFKELPLSGHVPSCNHVSCTSIFYRSKNCLGL